MLIGFCNKVEARGGSPATVNFRKGQSSNEESLFVPPDPESKMPKSVETPKSDWDGFFYLDPSGISVGPLKSSNKEDDARMGRLWSLYKSARWDFYADRIEGFDLKKSGKFLRDATENCISYIETVRAPRLSHSGTSQAFTRDQENLYEENLYELRNSLKVAEKVAGEGSEGKKRRFDVLTWPRSSQSQSPFIGHPPAGLDVPSPKAITIHSHPAQKTPLLSQTSTGNRHHEGHKEDREHPGARKKLVHLRLNLSPPNATVSSPSFRKYESVLPRVNQGKRNIISPRSMTGDPRDHIRDGHISYLDQARRTRSPERSRSRPSLRQHPYRRDTRDCARQGQGQTRGWYKGYAGIDSYRPLY